MLTKMWSHWSQLLIGIWNSADALENDSAVPQRSNVKLSYDSGFSSGSVVKNMPAMQETEFNPWVGKIPWRRKWQLLDSCFLDDVLWSTFCYILIIHSSIAGHLGNNLLIIMNNADKNICVQVKVLRHVYCCLGAKSRLTLSWPHAL